MNSVTENLPYAFALMIAIPFFVLLRQFVHSFSEIKRSELAVASLRDSQELRLQAFERMILFLERIRPTNLVNKFSEDLAVHEFIFLTEKNISEEFDYNASQQLYLSGNLWKNISETKRQLIDLLHSTYNGMGKDANLQDYKTILLMNYLNDGDAVQESIDAVRRELLLLTKIN